jgi:hypothetical protein
LKASGILETGNTWNWVTRQWASLAEHLLDVSEGLYFDIFEALLLELDSRFIHLGRLLAA